MSKKDILGQTVLDIFAICGLDEDSSLKLMQNMSEVMRKQNEELEIQNEAHALAGHNKELQNDIILLMKEYGLASGEAYELINRLSNAGNTEKLKASMPMDETVQESGTCEEPGDIADVMQCVYTSGEDPGDTHEPSKGSGTRDYERILKQLDWVLDTKLYISHYRLFNEIKEILKEHQVQNARAQYDVDKHTITNGYIETKPLTGVYDKNNKPDTMPIETLPKYKPQPLIMYANGQTPKIIETSEEAREYQLQAYKDMVITFMYGSKHLESTNIRNALHRTHVLSQGNVCHFNDQWYEIEQVQMKQFPSHEVIVKLKEVNKS